MLLIYIIFIWHDYSTDKIKNYIYPIITFITIILVWQFIVVNKSIPSYILPSPSKILKIFIVDWQNLQINTFITLKESVLGFILSILLASFIGVIMDFIPIIKKCF